MQPEFCDLGNSRQPAGCWVVQSPQSFATRTMRAREGFLWSVTWLLSCTALNLVGYITQLEPKPRLTFPSPVVSNKNNRWLSGLRVFVELWKSYIIHVATYNVAPFFWSIMWPKERCYSHATLAGLSLSTAVFITVNILTFFLITRTSGRTSSWMLAAA